MGQLEDMALFVRIVEAGGIGKAAEQSHLAKSAVSRRLSDLEERLGTQLISRTTRRANLTEAGKNYYRQALLILDEVEALNAQIRCEHHTLGGEMKISVPLSFGLLHFAPLLDQFARQHPELKVSVDLSDRYIDLVEQGVELAIRIGELTDSSLQARQLTHIGHSLCGSPQYLSEYGTPKTVDELKAHQFLYYNQTSSGPLTITGPDNQTHRLDVTTKIQSNNGDFLKEMALLGQGIALIPTFIAEQALADGQLQTLLPDHSLPEFTVWCVYPKTRYLSQRCRVLIDFLVEALA